MREAHTVPGFLEVARTGDTVIIRGHGLCLSIMCPSLSDFAGQMIDEGYTRFVVDLEDVTSLDSTFMGTLIGIHCQAMPLQEHAGQCALTVVNANPHCHKQMRMVGLTNLLCFIPDHVDFPDFETTILEVQEVSESQRILHIKEAHERLVEVDPQNEEKFGALLAALRREHP